MTDPRCMIGLHQYLEAPRAKYQPWLVVECCRCHSINLVHVDADGGPWTREGQTGFPFRQVS